jgi:hypothetical protein
MKVLVISRLPLLVVLGANILRVITISCDTAVELCSSTP